MRNLARNEIGLIALGHGNQQIGIVETGTCQYRRVGRVADYRLQVESIVQLRQALMVAIDHRNVVVFGDQALSNAGADLASALLKLHEDNAGTLTPDKVYARFYYSHPPASERIAALL